MNAPTLRPKIESIHVSGRRWFQRLYGNTYHSCEIIVNGERVHSYSFAYGYGDMYLQNAGDWLAENGYLDNPVNPNHGGRAPLWQVAKRDGFRFTYSVSDVGRKRDL